ncbi:MAG TPA: type II secretion system protein, partial [Verrucomicrobiae bacterium]
MSKHNYYRPEATFARIGHDEKHADTYFLPAMRSRGGQRGLTLIEVVITLAIVGIVVTSATSGFIYAARQMEQQTCATAAELMA